VNYQYHAEMLYVPLEWYNSLDANLQKILVESAKEHMLLNDQLLIQESKNSYEVLKAKMKVNVLTPEQRQVFIDSVQPVYDYFIGKGIFTQADIDQIRKIADGK
jgi:C4-dicarboxylate-binding protein DctP